MRQATVACDLVRGSTRGPREVATPRAGDISPAGVYLLDTATEQILWVGYHAAPPFLEAVFGTAQPRDGAPLQPASKSAEAAKLHALLDAASSARPHAVPLRVVVQGSPEQPRFFSRLLGESYEPFMVQMHASKVKAKL